MRPRWESGPAELVLPSTAATVVLDALGSAHLIAHTARTADADPDEADPVGTAARVTRRSRVVLRLAG